MSARNKKRTSDLKLRRVLCRYDDTRPSDVAAPVVPSFPSTMMPAPRGNATGAGPTDAIARRSHDQLDPCAANVNVVTSSLYERGKIPFAANTDLSAFEYRFRGASLDPTARHRPAAVRDTLHVHDSVVPVDPAKELGQKVAVADKALLLFVGDTVAPLPAELA